mmetsp:Transcript_1347/g.2755  ORF Transcript_1347/g.2755 Transcript_1347/m.2755 type:complete len:323 (-) Transcript_1347:2137-3105(-)
MNLAQSIETHVPIIDLCHPKSSDEEIAAIVRDAAIKHGFFAVTGHSVPKEVISRHVAVQKQFFSLPLEKKMQISVNKSNCGYTVIGEETLDVESSTVGDTREGLYYRRSSPGNPLDGQNQWPGEEDVPGYRSAVERYMDELTKLGYRLLELVSLSLGFDKSYLNAFFKEPMITLRPLKYQPVDSDERTGIYGAGKHTDYGCLTILYAPQPGLQIFQKGEWVAIDPLQDGFVINIGDMLEYWTCGLYKSTIHRVMTGHEKERYSFPFFFEPQFDAQIQPLPGYLPEGGAQKYPPITSGKYLLQKYAKTHAEFSKTMENSQNVM